MKKKKEAKTTSHFPLSHFFPTFSLPIIFRDREDLGILLT
jgi:hypothetical protein